MLTEPEYKVYKPIVPSGERVMVCFSTFGASVPCCGLGIATTASRPCLPDPPNAAAVMLTVMKPVASGVETDPNEGAKKSLFCTGQVATGLPFDVTDSAVKRRPSATVVSVNG